MLDEGEVPAGVGDKNLGHGRFSSGIWFPTENVVIKIIRQVLELLNNSLIANRISMASIGRLCVAKQFPGRARWRGLGDGTLRSVLEGQGSVLFQAVGRDEQEESRARARGEDVG